MGPSLAALLEWCDERGVILDDRIAVVQVPPDPEADEDLEWNAGPGSWTVRAKEGIARNDVGMCASYLVAWVTSAALLSIRSSMLSQNPIFKMVTSECKDDALHLALCLSYERHLGKASKFHGYIQSLPRYVSLPLCWPTHWDGYVWFSGTEAWRNIQRASQFWNADKHLKPGYSLVGSRLTQRRLESYWNRYGAHIVKHATSGVSFNDFVNAFTLVSSRAFVVNVFHGYVSRISLGLCMVPIADLFNHTDMHNVHVEAEENVCIYCGMVHLGSCRSVASTTTSSTVDVRCIEDIDADDELINTYGELGNAELLCQYGFVLGSKTLYDRCSWSPDLPSDRRELEYTLAHFLAYTATQDTHTPGLTQLLTSLDPRE